MIFRDIEKTGKKEIRISRMESFSVEKEHAETPVSYSQKMVDVKKGQNNIVRLHTTKQNQQMVSLQKVKRNVDTPYSSLLSSQKMRGEPLSFSFLRPIYGFLLLGTIAFFCLLFLIPLGKTLMLTGGVKASANNGFHSLMGATQDMLDFHVSSAEKQMNQARGYFDDVRDEMSTLTNFTRYVSFPGTDGALLSDILSIGDRLSLAGQKYVTIVQNIESVAKNMLSHSFAENKKTYPSLTNILNAERVRLQEGTDVLQEGYVGLQKIPRSVFPQNIQETLSRVDQKVKSMLVIARIIEEQVPLFLDIIGGEYPRKYLIILQNKDEMRATGGFIGSLIFMSFNDGWMTDLKFKDVYDFDGHLKEKIPAPEGLKSLSATWGLRDSNYVPDFFVAGQDITSMLEKTGGPTVDGVIAINQSLVEDFLGFTGPIVIDISIPGKKETRKLVFTQENFSILLSYIVESKLNMEQPKEILGKFVPLFLEKVKALPVYDLVDVFLRQLENNNVAVYSPWEQMEKSFARFGLDGRLQPVSDQGDYFMTVDTSISANKSDRYVTQQITHETFIDGMGKVIDRVSLSKNHAFDGQAEKYIQSVVQQSGFPAVSEGMMRLLGKGENVSYVRMYVPRGSVLLDSVGIPVEEIKSSEELGKTVFAFTMRVFPSNTRNVSLSYALPFHYTFQTVEKYGCLIQKQIGGLTTNVMKKVFVDNDLIVKEAFPKDGKKDLIFEKSSDLLNTQYSSVLVEKVK